MTRRQSGCCRQHVHQPTSPFSALMRSKLLDRVHLQASDQRGHGGIIGSRIQGGSHRLDCRARPIGQFGTWENRFKTGLEVAGNSQRCSVLVPKAEGSIRLIQHSPDVEACLFQSSCAFKHMHYSLHFTLQELHNLIPCAFLLRAVLLMPFSAFHEELHLGLVLSRCPC